jgi:hypothetical protein
VGVEVPSRPAAGPGRGDGAQAGLATAAGLHTALALTVTLAVAAFMLAGSALLLVIHPGSGLVARLVIEQNQGAKTALYLLAVVVIMPLALVAGPRLADAVAGGANGPAGAALAGVLTAGLVLALVTVRVSASLPWGDGLAVVLVATVLWGAFAAAVLARAVARPWPALIKLGSAPNLVAAVLGVLLVGAVLSFTSLRSVSVAALVVGLVLAGAALVCARRLPAVQLRRWQVAGIDVVIVVVLILAIPNVVVFHPSPGPPSSFFVPGIIQFHQDFLLGPTNQLLGGGALMVNVPVSQYGVGYIYFLYAWFHLAPIGYGTYGLLDGIVTALFYVAAFLVLRAARTPRPLAAAVMALAVVVLIYHLYYAVGSLPQQGPLRFGLPMVVIAAAAAAARWPQRATMARAAGLVTLGLAAIWSLEMFAYTLVVFAAVLANQAWLLERGGRLRWLARQAALGLGACVGAQLILAGATLAATGQLPDWGQYLAYVDALVLGGQKAGGISYGFADWSPVLLVGAASLASGAATVLLLRRAPALARREPVTLVALSGTSAYAIALLSYSDNRSSTYLLPYVALPTLLAGALWLTLLLRSHPDPGSPIRLGGLAFALSVAAIMLAAGWPGVDTNFANTALARAYPGGGLRSALTRLWRPPPIDPRAPGGEALLDRYAPAQRALVLLPDAPDLGTEILIRSHRANRLSIGDPKADAFVDASIWTGKLTRQLDQLRPGDRFLTDRAGLAIAAALRARPLSYPLAHPFDTDNPQTEWILQRLARRYGLAVIHADRAGLIIVALQRR